MDKTQKSLFFKLKKFHLRTWPRGYKKSCSTQLSMKIFPLINVEMQAIVGISTFMSSILGLSDPEKAEFLDIFILMSI